MTFEDDVRQLLDIDAIKRLKASYFRCIDTKEYSELRSLFTDDAYFLDLVVPCDDPDTFVSAVAKRHRNVTTFHLGSMPEIFLTGPSSASGRWTFIDHLEWPQNENPPEFPGARGFRGYGSYEEKYQRVGGVWKISAMRIVRIRVDPYIES